MLSISYSNKNILETVVSGFQQESDKIFKHLYKKHYPSVRSFISKNKGSHAEAEDIFQDALMAFYKQTRSGAFKGQSSPGTYLCAIAKNMWLGQLRKQKRINMVEINEDVVLKKAFSGNLEPGQRNKDDFHKAFEMLGEGCKQILTYYYYEDLSFAQIKDKLSLGSEQAVRTKKYRALQNLRSMLANPKISGCLFGD